MQRERRIHVVVANRPETMDKEFFSSNLPHSVRRTVASRLSDMTAGHDPFSADGFS